jgi:hypothetical protein
MHFPLTQDVEVEPEEPLDDEVEDEPVDEDTEPADEPPCGETTEHCPFTQEIDDPGGKDFPS